MSLVSTASSFFKACAEQVGYVADYAISHPKQVLLLATLMYVSAVNAKMLRGRCETIYTSWGTTVEFDVEDVRPCATFISLDEMITQICHGLLVRNNPHEIDTISKVIKDGECPEDYYYSPLGEPYR